MVEVFKPLFINALKAKEFVVFALVVFIGSLLGSFILGLFPAINPKEPFGAFVAFIIPVLLVYIIWKKWGERAAD